MRTIARRQLILILSIILTLLCGQTNSFSEESNLERGTEKTTEDGAPEESLVQRFELLEKTEDKIDWSRLESCLGIKTPSYPDYERLLIDAVPWFNPDESRLSGPDVHVSDLLIQKSYDEAIQRCLESLKGSWPFVGTETPLANVDSGLELQGATARFRFYLHAYARACELKGEYDKALNLYELLYGGNSSSTEEMKWIRARLSFLKNGTDADSSFPFIIKLLADYKEVNFDAVVAELEKWVELRKTGSVSSSDVIFADIILPIQSKSYECRYYAEARRLYVLRDRCAQIFNPRLHFTIDTRPNPSVDNRQPRYRLVLLSRASYLTFLDYMEEEYQKNLEQLEKAGREPGERLKAGMEVARQLARLPY